LVCTSLTLLKSPVPSAARQISAAIAAAMTGAISFEKFIELSLYSKNGFYNTIGKAGRRGDFITSPEVGPLFGAVIAQAIDARWHELDCPEKFTIVEVGAGPGTLARSVLKANLKCRHAISYIAVETSLAQRNLHPVEVISQAQMPTERFVGMVIANELVDNLPFRLFVFDSQWQEAFVIERDGKFLEVLHKVEDAPAWLPENPPLGTRLPVQRQAQKWLASSLQVLEHGSLIIFDYCMTSEVALRKPWRDWLRTYHQHEIGLHYLSQPGEQDITSHVMIDQLALITEPTSVSRQVDWLIKHGLNSLVDEGRNYWQAHAAKPDLQAMLMRSRVSESDSLCALDGLGNFTVLEWQK
jgi:SAM-dependent MidA family methyltransferase